MQVGMIGLGKMGANMVRRLIQAGHGCVVFDRSETAVEQLVKEGATGAHSLEDLCRKLSAPRSVCLMVPAGIVSGVLNELLPLLRSDDTVKAATHSGPISPVRSPTKRTSIS